MGAARAIEFPRGLVRLGLGAVGLGALVFLAIRADTSKPDASPWLTALDVVVGLAFVAAATGRVYLTERWLVAGVGVAWLAGSFLPMATSLHQGVLALALLAFPAGRVKGPSSWVLVGVAGLVAFQVLPQLGVALLFVAVAMSLVIAGRRDRAAAWFPMVAATAVAGALTASWAASRFWLGGFDPALAVVSYEGVLVVVAVGFPLAARAVGRARAKLGDVLLSNVRLEGLEGLAAVVRPALGDPDLGLYRWDGSTSAYVDGQGRTIHVGGDDRQWLFVDDSHGRLAVLAHRSAALDDPPTAAAITSAVRLAVRHLRLQEEQQDQLRELEASRARILAAADRARERAAAELRESVQGPLQLAQSELRALRSAVRDPQAVGALDVVEDELEAATGEITDVVAGVPPTRLGDGRLADALGGLAGRSPVPVSVSVAEDTGSSAETEAALFYVCSEALTNAVKHAAATRISITVRRVDHAMVAAVADDGRGGADPSGSGLQGLADRLTARKGRLRVESPPGAGTTVVATIPD